MELTAYFDNSATTAPSKMAVNKMMEACSSHYGNPSSLHSMGIEAGERITAARQAIASLLFCLKDEIYFTSGATEANNIAIFGAADAGRRKGRRIITTAIEHPSVLAPMDELERQGYEVIRLIPDERGVIDTDDIFDAVNEDTILISMMLANNETGAIQPVEAVRRAVKQSRSPALIHADCVQGFGKIPVKPYTLGVDLASVSAHKIHGPKGVGALYISKNCRITPMMFGGGQEKSIRPGTEPTELIAGFSGALEELPDVTGELEKITDLRDYLKDKLSLTEAVHINSADDALPYILNISVPGVRSETMLHFLAERGIYVSSGSACSGGKGSYVLTAQGLSRELVDSALRISFSRYNTKEEADLLVDALREGAQRLCRRRR